MLYKLRHRQLPIHRARTALIAFLLVCVALQVACSEPPPEEAPPAAHVRPYYGPTTMEERIIKADVIARVTLRSAATAAAHFAEGHPSNPYRSGIKYTFEVVDYLKGYGTTELVAIVNNPYPEAKFDTERAALDDARGLVNRHDTRWDDREAIIFLEDASNIGIDNYDYIFVMGYGLDEYGVDNDRNKVWLPASTPGGASGASGASSDSVRFITDASTRSEESSGASGAVGAASYPSITLADIRSQVADMNTLLEAGQGSADYIAEEYRNCLWQKYEWERRILWEKRNDTFQTYSFDFDLDSGMPAGTVIHSSRISGGIPGKPDEFWFEGPDKDLFFTEVAGVTVQNPESDDPFTRYSIDKGASRPLPQGDYLIYHNGQPYIFSICDGYRGNPYYDELKVRNAWHIHVNAPAGTLHEAFFDPVNIGEAVGAGYIVFGELSPDTLYVEGVGETTIELVQWTSGSVQMELASRTTLSGHHVDFIGLDGSTVLRLDFDDATETLEDGSQTLSWRVCERPWSAGDLLMFRISVSGSSLTGATNDATCDTNTATSTTDTVSTSTPP